MRFGPKHDYAALGMANEDRAARYSDLFGTGAEHEHTAAGNCAYCPICATIGVLRNTRPEVVEHLAAAAREIVIAAGMLLEEVEKAVGAAEAGGDADADQGVDDGTVRRIETG